MEHVELKLWEEKNSTEVLNLSETNGKNAANGTISKTERKLIVKHWRDTIPKGSSGVYRIKNKVNGRYYIGSARNLFNRLWTHLSTLINNTSHNRRLQNDWNKYGYKNFEFSVLEICERDLIMDVEQRYLDVGFLTPELFYNNKPVAKSGVTGRYSLELRRKMSERQNRNETKYDFYNIITKESIFCSIFELRDKYPELNRKTLGQIIRNDCDSYKGWILKHKLEKVLNSATIQGKTTLARIKTEEELRNPIIYHFINLKTKEEFIGSKFDLIEKYYYEGFSTLINGLASQKLLCAKFWVLKERQEEALSGKTFASKHLLTILNKELNPPSYELFNVFTNEIFNGTELEFRKLNNFNGKKEIKTLIDNKKFNHGFWIKKENYEKFLTSDHNACKMLRNKVAKLNNTPQTPL